MARHRKQQRAGYAQLGGSKPRCRGRAAHPTRKYSVATSAPARMDGTRAVKRPMPNIFMESAESHIRSGGFSKDQRPASAGVNQSRV